jgi:hypothetical protein
MHMVLLFSSNHLNIVAMYDLVDNHSLKWNFILVHSHLLEYAKNDHI